VLAYIESGKEQGARVVTGGQKWPQSNGGYWIEPTILADTSPDMKVVQEEVRSLRCLQDMADAGKDLWPSHRRLQVRFRRRGA